MVTTRTRPPLALYASLLTAVLVAELAAVHSAAYRRNPDLVSLAVTFDLTIVLPLLHYFLLVRRRHLPSLTLLPAFALGAATAQAILPRGSQAPLELLRFVLPLVELASLALLVGRLRTVIRHWRALRADTPYALEALRGALRRGLGPVLGGALGTEAVLMGAAVLGWVRRFRPRPGEQAYSCHRETGWGAILLALVLLILPESLISHVLLRQWSPVAAVVWTSLELYGVVWLLGDYQMLRLQPLVLDRQVLHVRTGLRWSVDLPLATIAEATAAPPATRPEERGLSLAFRGEPNVTMRLHEPVAVHGLFGRRPLASRLELRVDEPERFLADLTRRRAEA
jgi:hypothetical protein